MTPFSTRRSRRAFVTTAAASVGAVTATSRAFAAPGIIRTSASRSQDVGSVQFMNWEAMEGTPTEQAIFAYQEATGRAVEIVPNPGTGTDYETKIRTMLAGDTVPDIIRTNDDFVRFYSSKGQFTNLQTYMDRDGITGDNYFPPVYDFARQPDGQYTAWVLGNQPRLIYYNIDLFEKAGVPLPPKDWTSEGWTWDDFVEKAKALTIPGEQWGALVYDDTGCEQTFSVNNGLTDGIYTADGTTFNLAEPAGAEAIQWLADLTLVHGVQPERGLVTEANSGNGLFLQGKVAMIFRTQGTLAYFRNNDIGFRFDVATPPAKVDHKTEGSLICYAIPTSAKNPDGAWELLKWLGGEGGATIFAQRGDFIPGYRPAAETMTATEGTDPASFALFPTAMDYNTAVHFTDVTENARNVYRPQLDLVWTGESTAADVLSGVKQEVEEILSGEF